MYKEKIRFNQNKKLTILQVSDAQDMHIPRRAMFRMLNRAYDKVKPDLIVLTGDNILGNHIDDAAIGSRKSTKTKEDTLNRMKKALDFLLKPINDRKIPFAMIYGNHDDMNCITKDEQAEIYKAYAYCTGFNAQGDSPDCDTYSLPVYGSTEDKIKYNLWMMDSAGADDAGKKTFVYVKPEAVDWYIKRSNELKAENGGNPVMSLMFQHIPIPETTQFFKPCSKDTKGAVPARDGNHYVLDSDKASGFAFEYPEVCQKDAGQLDAVVRQGDVCAMVFGHDHLNCFVGKLRGINIVQTPGASFRSYGNSVSRGVRVFEIDEDNPSAFDTYTIGYFDLMGRKFRSVLGYIFSADEMEKTKNMLLALLSLIGLGLLALIILFLL